MNELTPYHEKTSWNDPFVNRILSPKSIHGDRSPKKASISNNVPNIQSGATVISVCTHDSYWKCSYWNDIERGIREYVRQELEKNMEKVLRKLTLNFFGKGKHKISPNKFFEMENGFLLDVRSKEEADSILTEALKPGPVLKALQGKK